MKLEKQMSETYFVAAVLAGVGGFLDAYTYICRGNVFANAQTGNIILFGIQLAELNFHKAFYYLVPIVSFFIGILIAEGIKNKYKYNSNIHWRQITIAMECAFLFIAGCIPKGNLDTIVNVIVSFVCSLQVQSFRKINGNAYATTMCTGNLRSASEQLFKFRITRDKSFLRNSIQYFGIILFFIVGACVGAVMTNLYEAKSVYACCAGLLLVLLLMFIKKDES